MTEIQDVQEQQFADLFPELNKQDGPKNSASFSYQETGHGDILSSTTETTTLASTTETTTLSSTTETTTNPDANADILSDNEEGKVVNTQGPEISDLSQYFSDRIKSGKFVQIKEEGEDGSEKIFIPKTAEEFDEVFDIQLDVQLKQKAKELEENWYKSKSPAWHAVARFAEMTDDPTEVIPFIQGIQNINSVSTVNEDEIDGAELIVRSRLEQRGESKDIIDEQIDALKTTDKLIATAKKYKPLILKQEKMQLDSMMHQKQEQIERYEQMVEKIRIEAIKAIENPIFGKQILKQEEKAAVYDLIGVPEESSKGYGIYTVIDNLFEQGDFETLKQIALLAAKKDSFYNYVNNSAADKTAAGLERKLRAAVDSRSGSGKDLEIDDSKPTVRRNQYNRTARFGRG